MLSETNILICYMPKMELRMQSYDVMNIAKISRLSDKKSTEANPDPDPDRRRLRGWPVPEFLFTGGREVAGGRCGRGVEETAVAAGDEGRGAGLQGGFPFFRTPR